MSATETSDSNLCHDIARAIAATADEDAQGATPEDWAKWAGLDPLDFESAFSRLMGVTPALFRKGYAPFGSSAALRERTTALNLEPDENLSGSSQLFDLSLRWFAEPGRLPAKHGKIRLTWGLFDSQFGRMLIESTETGICGLSFQVNGYEDEIVRRIEERLPKAKVVRDQEGLSHAASAIVTQKGELNLHFWGTPFQVKVWKALLSVPAGALSTYESVAVAAGSPRGARAAGGAVGKNPIPWLIPCHRIIRKSGNIGGYGGGLERKRSLLAHEFARCDASPKAD